MHKWEEDGGKKGAKERRNKRVMYERTGETKKNRKKEKEREC